MRRCANLIFVCALCANLAWAISVEQYRKNLAEAKIALENSQGDFLTADEAPDFTGTAKQVERLVPARQTVESADKTSVETDNGWLAAELKAVAATAAVDDKLIKINFIIERIAAIENRLAELKTAQTMQAKADDKQALNEILRRAEYQKAQPEQEKSVLQRILDGFSKWISDFFRWLFGDRAPTPIENAPAPNFSAIGTILQYAVIALAVAIIGFVFWRFVLPLFGDERRARKSKRKEPRVILGETLAADETADNLLLEAERLATSGNVRAAIRKGYIAVLCDLNDRKLLGLARHKTNRDYLRDIERKRQTIFQPMRFLTNSFERHWYGEAEASERDWQEFREQFTIINRQ